MRSRIDWRQQGSSLILDVLDYRIRITPAALSSGYLWSLSTGERGRSETLLEAQETSTYHLRLTLENDEQSDSQNYALELLDDLEIVPEIGPRLSIQKQKRPKPKASKTNF